MSEQEETNSFPNGYGEVVRTLATVRLRDGQEALATYVREQRAWCEDGLRTWRSNLLTYSHFPDQHRYAAEHGILFLNGRIAALEEEELQEHHG